MNITSKFQLLSFFPRPILVQFCFKLSSLVLLVVVNGIVGRHLGPIRTGQISYAIVIITLILPIRGLGTKESLRGALSRSDDVYSLMGSAILIEFAGSLLASLIIVIYALKSSNTTISSILYLALPLFLVLPFELLDCELYQKGKGASLSFADFLSACGHGLFNLYGVLFNLSTTYFGFSQISQLFLKPFACLVLGLINGTSLNLRLVRCSTAFSLLRRGIPLMISGVLIMLYLRIDQVMIPMFCGNNSFDELGQYSVAVRLAESGYFMAPLLHFNYTPHLSSLREGSEEATRSLFRLSWIFGVIVAFLTFFICPSIVSILYGPGYLAASQLLCYLSPAAFGVFIGSSTGAWLNSNGFVRDVLYRAVFGLFVNIVLNSILLPQYGSVGAAIATSISYVSGVLVLGLVRPATRSNTLLALYPF